MPAKIVSGILREYNDDIYAYDYYQHDDQHGDDNYHNDEDFACCELVGQQWQGSTHLGVRIQLLHEASLAEFRQAYCQCGQQTNRNSPKISPARVRLLRTT